MDLAIINQIRTSFEDLPDHRKAGNNRNNAQSIFGVHQIPSTSQIGNLLDPIAPETLYPVLAEVGDRLYTGGCLKPFVNVGGTLLVALDGTDSFSSEKISCPCCTQQTLKNGQTLYRHTLVTPVIVAPGQSQVVPLPPEFVRVQDGVDKQDCELAAAKRWLTNWGAHYTRRGITVLGDDLYCHQPFCEAVRAQHMDFLFVCKPDSHVLLYEWLDDFTRTGEVQTLEKSRWNGKQLDRTLSVFQPSPTPQQRRCVNGQLVRSDDSQCQTRSGLPQCLGNVTHS